jgi:hypothetical protein
VAKNIARHNNVLGAYNGDQPWIACISHMPDCACANPRFNGALFAPPIENFLRFAGTLSESALS